MCILEESCKKCIEMQESYNYCIILQESCKKYVFGRILQYYCNKCIFAQLGLAWKIPPDFNKRLKRIVTQHKTHKRVFSVSSLEQNIVQYQDHWLRMQWLYSSTKINDIRSTFHKLNHLKSRKNTVLPFTIFIDCKTSIAAKLCISSTHLINFSCLKLYLF